MVASALLCSCVCYAVILALWVLPECCAWLSGDCFAVFTVFSVVAMVLLWHCNC